MILARGLTGISLHEQYQWWYDRLVANSPASQVYNINIEIEQYLYKLLKTYDKQFENKTALLRELRVRLEALSPIAILERGYSITRTIPDSKVVLNPRMVSINQDLEVMVAKGTLTCRVKGKFENGPKNF